MITNGIARVFPHSANRVDLALAEVNTLPSDKESHIFPDSLREALLAQIVCEFQCCDCADKTYKADCEPVIRLSSSWAKSDESVSAHVVDARCSPERVHCKRNGAMG